MSSYEVYRSSTYWQMVHANRARRIAHTEVRRTGPAPNCITEFEPQKPIITFIPDRAAPVYSRLRPDGSLELLLDPAGAPAALAPGSRQPMTATHPQRPSKVVARFKSRSGIKRDVDAELLAQLAVSRTRQEATAKTSTITDSLGGAPFRKTGPEVKNGLRVNTLRNNLCPHPQPLDHWVERWHCRSTLRARPIPKALSGHWWSFGGHGCLRQLLQGKSTAVIKGYTANRRDEMYAAWHAACDRGEHGYPVNPVLAAALSPGPSPPFLCTPMAEPLFRFWTPSLVPKTTPRADMKPKIPLFTITPGGAPVHISSHSPSLTETDATAVGAMAPGLKAYGVRSAGAGWVYGDIEDTRRKFHALQAAGQKVEMATANGFTRALAFAERAGPAPGSVEAAQHAAWASDENRARRRHLSADCPKKGIQSSPNQMPEKEKESSTREEQPHAIAETKEMGAGVHRDTIDDGISNGGSTGTFFTSISSPRNPRGHPQSATGTSSHATCASNTVAQRKQCSLGLARSYKNTFILQRAATNPILHLPRDLYPTSPILHLPRGSYLQDPEDLPICVQRSQDDLALGADVVAGEALVSREREGWVEPVKDWVRMTVHTDCAALGAMCLYTAKRPAAGRGAGIRHGPRAIFGVWYQEGRQTLQKISMASIAQKKADDKLKKAAARRGSRLTRKTGQELPPCKQGNPGNFAGTRLVFLEKGEGAYLECKGGGTGEVFLKKFMHDYWVAFNWYDDLDPKDPLAKFGMKQGRAGHPNLYSVAPDLSVAPDVSVTPGPSIVPDVPEGSVMPDAFNVSVVLEAAAATGVADIMQDGGWASTGGIDPALRVDVQMLVTEAGLENKYKLNFRCECAKDLLDAESDEICTAVSAALDEAHQEALAKYKKQADLLVNPATPDEDAQAECRKNIVQVVQPFLDGMVKLTGYHVTLLAGAGPPEGSVRYSLTLQGLKNF
ncbi:hypothetical protein DFH09DRAFT_1109714 [Mycena vulgaris]|nr:hypothetical protein DFH09DRAFT_1109714 [Mycena vulgaris]